MNGPNNSSEDHKINASWCYDRCSSQHSALHTATMQRLWEVCVWSLLEERGDHYQSIYSSTGTWTFIILTVTNHKTRGCCSGWCSVFGFAWLLSSLSSSVFFLFFSPTSEKSPLRSQPSRRCPLEGDTVWGRLWAAGSWRRIYDSPRSSWCSLSYSPHCGETEPMHYLHLSLFYLHFCVTFNVIGWPAHAVQGLVEDLRGEGVLLLQDLTLLQRHRHGCAVLGAFTAGETHPVQAAAHL